MWPSLAFELSVFLPQTPEDWDYRIMSLYPALNYFNFKRHNYTKVKQAQVYMCKKYKSAGCQWLSGSVAHACSPNYSGGSWFIASPGK
jgi:hypothetical protein